MEINPIYKFMKENKLTQMDEASFSKAYSDPQKSAQIHKFMVDNKLTNLDANAFHSAYFDPSKKKEPTTQGSGQPAKPSAPSFGQKVINETLVSGKPVMKGVNKEPQKKEQDITFRRQELPSETTQAQVPQVAKTIKSVEEKAQEGKFVQSPVTKISEEKGTDWSSDETIKKVNEKAFEKSQQALQEKGVNLLSKEDVDDQIKREYEAQFGEEIDSYMESAGNKSDKFFPYFTVAPADLTDLQIALGKREVPNGTTIEKEGKRGEITSALMDDYFTYMKAKYPDAGEAEQNKYQVLKSRADRSAKNEEWLHSMETRAIQMKMSAVKRNYEKQKSAVNEYSQIESSIDTRMFDSGMIALNKERSAVDSEYKRLNERANQSSSQWNEKEAAFNKAIKDLNSKSSSMKPEDYEAEFNKISNEYKSEYEAYKSKYPDFTELEARSNKLQQDYETLRVKSRMTDENVAKLQQAKGAYQQLGQSALSLKALGTMNQDNINYYSEYSTLKDQIEQGQEAGKQRWESASPLMKMVYAPGELANKFVGGIGNLALNIVELPKVAEDLITGNTEYNFLDEFYDGVENFRMKKQVDYPNIDSDSTIQYLSALGGNTLSSLAVFALGGSFGGASKMSQFGATFVSSMLTTEVGAYEEAINTHKMSPRQAAAASTAVAVATSLMEGLIPDIKYFEPSAFRTSILNEIAKGKSISQALRAALPESAQSYLLSGLKEGGEELAQQTADDGVKKFINYIGETEYFKNLLDGRAYQDAALGGLIGGGVGNFFKRPVGASNISEEVMLEAAENADGIIAAYNNNDNIGKLKQDMKGPTQDFMNLSAHPNWKNLDRPKKARAFGITQQIRTLEETNLKDPIINAQIERLKNERQEILSIGENGISAKSVGTSTTPQRVKVGGEYASFFINEDGDYEIEYNNGRSVIVEKGEGVADKIREMGIETDEGIVGEMNIENQNTLITPTLEKGATINYAGKNATLNNYAEKNGKIVSVNITTEDGKTLQIREGQQGNSKQLLENLNSLKYDQENVQGIPSEVGVGQEPVTAQPIEATSEEAPATSGVLQAQEEVTPEAAPQPTQEVTPTVTVEAPTVTVETTPAPKPSRKQRVGKMFGEEEEKTGKSETPTEKTVKVSEVAPTPRRVGAVEASEGSNEEAGTESALKGVNLDETTLEDWKKKNKAPSKKGRIEELTQAVRDLMSGKTKFKDYYERAKQMMPSKLMEKVPTPASFLEVVGSIDKNKLKIGIINLNKFVKKGMRVGLRIDIPAFNNFGKSIVTVHDKTGSGQPVIGYGSTGSISNVKFKTSVSTAAKIGSGEQKSAFAMAEGEWMDESPESIQARAEEALNSPEWVQVSMNPSRSSFFFDKADGNPIVAADEVLQVGNLVLAKNPQKIDLNTKEGMAQFEQQFSAKTKEGVTYQYRTNKLSPSKKTETSEGEEAVLLIKQALSESGIEVEVKNDADYNNDERIKRGQGSGSEGMFLADDGAVILNRDKIKGEWGKTIVFHEGIHPVINIIRNTDPKRYKAIVDGLKAEAAKNNDVAEAAAEIAGSKEYQDRGAETIEDETVVETMARVATGDIDIDTFEPNFREKFIEFMNDIAKMLGLRPILTNSPRVEVKRLADQINNMLNEGGKLSDIVGKKNVGKFQNELAQARVTAGEVLSKERAEQKKVTEVADTFEKAVDNVLDPSSDPKNRVKRFLENAYEDLRYFFSEYSGDTGLDWYTNKVKEFDAKLKEVSDIAILRGEMSKENSLSNEDNMNLFRVVLALSSIGVNPRENVKAAFSIWKTFDQNTKTFSKYQPGQVSVRTNIDDGKGGYLAPSGIIEKETNSFIDIKQTNGKVIRLKKSDLAKEFDVTYRDKNGKEQTKKGIRLFKSGPVNTTFRKGNQMVKIPNEDILDQAETDNGIKGKGWTTKGSIVVINLERIEKLLASTTTVKDAVNWLNSKHPVAELREYNPLLPDVEGGKGKINPKGERIGSYIIGEKLGAFHQNVAGTPTELTMDLWWSRTWNRYMGTLMITDEKGEPAIQETPRTDSERNIMREAAAEAANSLGLEVHELQAALWYLEQQVYKRMGAAVESYSFVDGVNQLLLKYGKTNEEIQPERYGVDSSETEKRREAAATRAANIVYGKGGEKGTAKVEQPSKPTIGQPSKGINRGSNLVKETYYESGLTEDKNDYVFFHVSSAPKASIMKGVDSTKYTSLRTAREEKGLQYGVASYYTRPEDGERMVGGEKYSVRVPKGKVYPIDSDPMGYGEKAEASIPQGTPFRGEAVKREIADMAKKDGYQMIVGEWSYSRTGKPAGEIPEFRADALVPLKPTAEKPDSFTSNAEKGMERIPFPGQQSEEAKQELENIASEVRDAMSSKKKFSGKEYELANSVYMSGQVTENKGEDNESKRDITPEEYDTMTKVLPKSMQAEAARVRGLLFGGRGQASMSIPRTSKEFSGNASETVDRIKNATSEDGATLNVDGTTYENGGLVVPAGSSNVAQEDVSSEGLYGFLKDNEENISSDIFKIGLYKFPDRPEVSYDLNIVTPREHRDVALEFARLAGQESLFDLDTFENIKTGADGKNPRKFTAQELAEIAKDLSEGRLPKIVSKEEIDKKWGEKKMIALTKRDELGTKADREIAAYASKFLNKFGPYTKANVVQIMKMSAEEKIKLINDTFNSRVKKMMGSKEPGDYFYDQSVKRRDQVLDLVASENTKRGQPSKLNRTPTQVRQSVEDGVDSVEEAIAQGMDPQQAIDENISSQEWYGDLSDAQKEQLNEILQDEFGATVSEPKQVTPVGEQIANIIDNYYKGDRQSKLDNKQILESNPKLKYIYDNIAKINKQLQEAGVITDKTDGCP